ncbi:MAG: response regulator [Candidatus Sumerlaeia bacterium]|nr:response regulator [Candidatus Sumerlaeia bacterium]
MPTTKPRILAVDDENDILLILRTALKDEYEVLTASNGPDALHTIESEKPELVILDMMMPDMDGLEVLQEIRRMESSATIPVIFLTGVSDRAKIREALDKGTNYYIVKPFDCTELSNKVGFALKESKGAF